jgi:hypothetical protein
VTARLYTAGDRWLPQHAFISDLPGPGTPLSPGLGRRCAVPNVMVPGYAAVDSGCCPIEDCRQRHELSNTRMLFQAGSRLLVMMQCTGSGSFCSTDAWLQLT